MDKDPPIDVPESGIEPKRQVSDVSHKIWEPLFAHVLPSRSKICL